MEMTKEDCLIAMAYAAEHDDFEEVQELVECAGREILSTRLPFAHLGTILHVCTDFASFTTLEKVLEGYPDESLIDVYIRDTDGDTALHNLANIPNVTKDLYDKLKKTASLLLDLHGVDANKLLGIQNNYGNMTALCKALMYWEPIVCQALLDAAAAKAKDQDEPTWLALTALVRGYEGEYCATALHHAVWRNYGDVVTKILAYPGVEKLKLTSLTDQDGDTPLHNVAYTGHLEICAMLLDYCKEDGGGVIIPNKEGETPLHIASTHGHTGVCEKLLQYGASLSLPDNHGKYALTNSLGEHHTETVKKLLDACLPTTRAQDSSLSAVHEPEAEQRTPSCPISARPIKGSIDVNKKFEFGLTALHVAVLICSENHISSLIKSGASVDSRSDDDRTPLHAAAQRHDTNALNMLALLVEAAKTKMNEEKLKLWINMTDISGQTALHKYIVSLSSHSTKGQSEGRVENSEITEDDNSTGDKVAMVTQFLSQGAWVDVQDCEGETLLHAAMRSKHKKAVDTLLSSVKDKNFRRGIEDVDKWICMCDFSGETALHEAARVGDADLVQQLLKKTKDANYLLRIRDMENMTACDWAARHRNDHQCIMKKMMECPGINELTKKFLMWHLQEHIDPHVHREYCRKYDVKGNQTSLLQKAVHDKDVDIARELINRGADVTALQSSDDHRWLAEYLGKAASDRPTLEDTLGRRKLVQGVATLLLNPYTGTPVTIGIFGGWGTGKSSFMFQVEEAMLHMAVKETFKKTPLTKFSKCGVVLGYVVARTLKHCMIKANKYNRNASGESQTFTKTTTKADVESPKDEVDIIDGFPMELQSKYRPLFKNLALLAKLCQTFTKTTPKADVESQKDEVDIIDRFPMELQSKYRPLFKNLALTDKSKLVQTHARYKRKVGKYQTLQDAHLIAYTPAVLTVHYNAWQYDNKNEASAGLAVEISRQLESSLTPHQWLRMCWKYSWKSRPSEIFVQLILPILLALVAICVILVLWKFVPTKTIYKALSVPMGVLGVMWAFFKVSLNVIQPVTQTMLNLVKSIDHQSMLGYQHQVINDIKFLKTQLCEDAHFGWKLLGFFCQLFISNSYFMDGTWIWKQHPSLNNFKIMVFIDDLDRCDEKTILELLRAINLILGSCGINVLIGVDKEMLQRAITREFLNLDGDKMLELMEDHQVEKEDRKNNQGEKDVEKVESCKKFIPQHKYSQTQEFADKYLQKIVQLPIQLPDPSVKHLKQFLQVEVGKHFSRDKVECTQIKAQEDKKMEKNIESNKEDEEKNKLKDGGDLKGENMERNIETNKKDMKKNKPKDEGSQQSQDATKDAGVEKPFHLLLANYTPMEEDLLKHLCQLTSKERRIPREWKRFLNYHRLAWTILSEEPNIKNTKYKGWQRKLILWIFICWNWRHQMDEIFKNWKVLSSKASKTDAKKKKAKNDGGSLKLCDIICAHMEWNTKEDIGQVGKNQEDDLVSKAWSDLHKTLKDEYDITFDFIEKFQQFRFYCVLNHLEIDEGS